MEVVTLQCGNYANYVGAHFWNAQEALFSYDPAAKVRGISRIKKSQIPLFNPVCLDFKPAHIICSPRRCCTTCCSGRG